jgi:molybdopterin synthase catalytic subunit
VKITLLFYAVVRERLGQERAELEVPSGITAAELRERLAQAFPALAPLLPRVMLAVNREYAHAADAVPDGAEVALIPPIAGGAPRLSRQPLELDRVMEKVRWPGAGAVVTFSGVVRDESHGRRVSQLEYETYPEMAETKLAEVEAEVTTRWPSVRCALLHRVGTLEVGEVAVVIAVAAPHRREAFAACEFAIDRLKATVPLWKRETGEGGSVWVEECVPEPRGPTP